MADITAEQFNERVRAAMRNVPLRGLRTESGTGRAQHKWKTFTRRSRRDLTGRTWDVLVGDGCVNDTPAVSIDTPLWRRPLLELSAPDATLQKLGHFARVGDGARPPFFRTAAMWECDLYRSSIVVSGVRPVDASALLLEFPTFPTPSTLVGLIAELGIRQTLASLGLLERIAMQRLRPPYKVRVANVPALLDGTEQRRLAWLYLSRRLGAPPHEDEIHVQQVEHWNLQAWSVLEDAALGALLPVLQGTGNVGQLTALEIFRLLLDTTRIEWWNA